MVKLVDVAKAAGVSRGTASNVFTHPELVSEALRERVLAAASELGYGGPNPSGRLLRLGKVNAIGATPPGSYGVSVAFINPYFREFLSGVGEVCDERGASLTVISGVGPDKTRGIKNALVDGFILHQVEDATFLEARQRRLPFVVVDIEGDAETNSVRIDDRDRRAAGRGAPDCPGSSTLRDLLRFATGPFSRSGAEPRTCVSRRGGEPPPAGARLLDRR